MVVRMVLSNPSSPSRLVDSPDCDWFDKRWALLLLVVFPPFVFGTETYWSEMMAAHALSPFSYNEVLISIFGPKFKSVPPSAPLLPLSCPSDDEDDNEHVFLAENDDGGDAAVPSPVLGGEAGGALHSSVPGPSHCR